MGIAIIFTVVVSLLAAWAYANRTRTVTTRAPKREAVTYWADRSREAAKARNGVRL